jgi:pimeloyl-ACP methyl ester carboxylesterase
MIAASPAVAAPTLIAATPMIDPPRFANAWRIRYRSTGIDGQPVTVTGLVIVPRAAAPPGGRDIVAWAHGATGIADACAPSMTDYAFLIPGIERLVNAGYVVVATDYAGLGGPGPHAFLVGDSAARSVIDAVRAARDMRGVRTTGRFVVAGESQGGHAALWTGRIAPRYAPDLKLLGVAALEPPTDLRANLTGGTNAGVRAFLTSFTAASWSEVYHLPLSTVVRPAGANLIHRIAQNCVTLDGFKLRTKIGLARLMGQLRGVDLGASPRWTALMEQNSVAPQPLGVPLLIAQGGKDQVVAPAVTRQFAAQLCRAGQPLRFIADADANHMDLGTRNAAAMADWIGDRFAGRAVPDNCSEL